MTTTTATPEYLQTSEKMTSPMKRVSFATNRDLMADLNNNNIISNNNNNNNISSPMGNSPFVKKSPVGLASKDQFLQQVIQYLSYYNDNDIII